VHESLIKTLLQPSRYPHKVSGIRLCETHISWVILTGEYAYKIKKPVKLSFLDFSTLELRKHFCEEELRLNRRFAPGIYLGVVPICGSVEEPVVDGAGPAIEYAVKLKQFLRKDELTHLIANQKLDGDMFARFGRTLAQTHATLPRVTDISPRDFTDSVALNIADLHTLLPNDARIKAIDTAITTMEKDLAQSLAQRYKTTAIRECHGDLHLGNVVRIDGDLTPFDCIEFDPKLRNIDVLNDIAFLQMDIEAQGHRDLAYCLMNAWLVESGDYAGLPLLRYYSAHRALVRAKVSAMQSAKAATIDLYLAEAKRQLGPRSPRLIITCGLSGSGKTWLSYQLATAVPAIHVRSDVERKRLAGLSALASSRSQPGAGIYTADFNTQTYARLLHCARSALLGGENVIVDAAFLRADERAAFMKLASEVRASFSIVYCTAPEAILKERIQRRQRSATDASEATVEVLAQQSGYFEPLSANEKECSIEVNTSNVSWAPLFAALVSNDEPSNAATVN
jgi:aminoglycoside phosphotransferase family enzyme/predicted kinase